MKNLYKKKKRINKILSIFYAIDVLCFFLLVAAASSIEHTDVTLEYVVTILSILMIYAGFVGITAAAVHTARRINRMIKSRHAAISNRLHAALEE